MPGSGVENRLSDTWGLSGYAQWIYRSKGCVYKRLSSHKWLLNTGIASCFNSSFLTVVAPNSYHLHFIAFPFNVNVFIKKGGIKKFTMATTLYFFAATF